MSNAPNLSPSSGRYDLEPPVILLGEDDETFRMLVAGVLRRDGYVVLEAKNGGILRELVLALLRSGRQPRPELIISDIRMPGASGLEVVEILRELDWHTPVILMTGFGGPETDEEASHWGVHAVMSKPFELEDLRSRVHEVVPPL